MPHATLGFVLSHLRQTRAAAEARDLTDGELLQRFLADREEAAFAILVQRHGPMVLGVCRRVLGDVSSAEDSFQATFLVLARRAASIQSNSSLAGWLYGVAQRIALKAKVQALARRNRERQVEIMPRAEPLDELTWRELRSVLDQEIAGLPEKYRAPLVLCYFEGKSYALAAQELGWPKGSLARRIARGRELLRKQLVQRGITLSAATLATVLCEKVNGSPVGAVLSMHTIQAATVVARGQQALGGCLSPEALALSQEATSFQVKSKLLFLVLALGLAAGGVSLAAYSASEPLTSSEGSEAPRLLQQDGAPSQESKRLLTADERSDPLPTGAVTRFGTARFRPGAGTKALAFAPAGKILAATSIWGFGVFLWDAASGQPRGRLPIDILDDCNSLVFSPDGQTLLTNERNLLDVATGKIIRHFDFSSRRIGSNCAAISPDGLTVAAESEQNATSATVLWELATGHVLRRIDGHTGFVRGLAFAPDSKSLASASDDKTVRIWEVATGKELRRLEGNPKGARSVAFAPGGSLLASAGQNGATRLWDVTTGTLLHEINSSAGKTVIAFSPDGKLLAAADDRMIGLWNPHTGKEIRRWQAHTSAVQSIAFAPDGKVLATAGSFDHAIRRWHTATVAEINPLVGHAGGVTSLVFGSGNTLVTWGNDRQILEWDVATGQERRRLLAGLHGNSKDWQGWMLHAVSPGGAVTARTRREDKPHSAIRLWDPQTGKEISSLSEHQGAVMTLRFAPDGKLLAAGSEDGIRIWDIAAGRQLHHVRVPQPQPRERWQDWTLAFSPDGKLLAWFGVDGWIGLCEVATGNVLRRWDSQQRGTDAFLFSPDSQSLVSADGQAVRSWDAATGKERLNFINDMHIGTLALSPSGRMLAIGERPGSAIASKSFDKPCTIWLWDAYSGQKIRHIGAPQTMLLCLAFAPDGRTLASGGGDSTILLWNVTGRTSESAAKNKPLTQAEVDSWWSRLAGDALQADAAIGNMIAAPEQSLAVLKKALKPAPPAPVDNIAQLIGDLDSGTFAVRAKATRALEELGEAAEAALWRVLANHPPLEIQRRVEQVLQKRDHDVIRQLRALEVLGQIATPEAQRVLEALLAGTPNPRIARAATAALQRLTKRPS
jgi:RNA polymerase sigma factor (sigma-70 family)